MIANKISQFGLSNEESQRILSGLLSYRGYRERISNFPDSFLKDLMAEENDSRQLYLPLDAVDLRPFLLSNKVFGKFLLFNIDFVKSHKKDYPVYVELEIPKDKLKGKGAFYVESNELGEYAKSIFINAGMHDVETINKILNTINCLTDLETHAMIDIPEKTTKEASLKNKVAQVTNLELKTTSNQAKILEFVRQGLETYSNLDAWVVGGYVRDSLMGKESDDLDIALSSGSTGLDFAEFLKHMGSQMNPNPTGKVYSTALDKTDTGSGDLQVAALEIYGEKIDFVNLRTEEYSETSRVPVQTMTDNPAEDAQRRDLTINSLYYNIKSGKIEDYIGGLRDFEPNADGTFSPTVLRTPVDPKQTFMDDPLRMLRVLRFYSRYDNSMIDPNVLAAFQDPEVLAMYDKLAPERAAKEIRKMMQGPQVVEATHAMFETGLYKKVFNVPEDWQSIAMDQQNPYHQYTLQEHTLSLMDQFNDIFERYDIESDKKGLMMLSIFFHDFGKMHPSIRKQKIDSKTNQPVQFDRNGEMVDRHTYVMHEKESANFAAQIMKDMGFGPDEKKFVTTVVGQHMVPNNFYKGMKDKAIGKFLHALGDLDPKFNLAHSHLDMMAKGDMSDEEKEEYHQQALEIQNRVQEYRDAMQVDGMDLVKQPLVDGNAVGAIVAEVAPELANNKAMLRMKGNPKPMHHIKIILEKLMEQQWARSVVNREQAVTFVRNYAKQVRNMWNQQQQQQQSQQGILKQQSRLKDAIVKKSEQQDRIKNALSEKIQQQDRLKNAIVEAQSMGMGLDTIYLEGDPVANKDDDWTMLKRNVEVQFEVGDKVKRRNKGFNFSQKQGTVVKIENNIMTVRWDSGKKKKYSLLKPEKLFAELEKV